MQYTDLYFVLVFICGFATCGLCLFLWVIVIEPWWINRNTERAYKHLDNQFVRGMKLSELRAMYAKETDPAQAAKIWDAIQHITLAKRLSHEVYSSLHPARPVKGKSSAYQSTSSDNWPPVDRQHRRI